MSIPYHNLIPKVEDSFFYFIKSNADLFPSINIYRSMDIIAQLGIQIPNISVVCADASPLGDDDALAATDVNTEQLSVRVMITSVAKNDKDASDLVLNTCRDYHNFTVGSVKAIFRQTQDVLISAFSALSVSGVEIVRIDRPSQHFEPVGSYGYQTTLTFTVAANPKD
jgi:hypothetical protein